MANNQAEETTLLTLLHTQLNQKVYPVHRLDRKTSGIILLVKDKKYAATFQELFTNSQIQKTYYGIVRGFSPKTLTIDSPVKGRDALVYKAAETKLTTLATHTLDIAVHPYSTARYSLVKLEPKTGRLHQLRIHANKISHPLIGDPKYGDRFHNRMFEKEFHCDKLFLHAQQLQFMHPFTEKELTISAPFPKDWKTIFKTFDWNLEES